MLERQAMQILQAGELLLEADDPLIRARAAALLEAAPAPAAVLDALGAQQNPDGGWPLQGVAGNPSCVDDTVTQLLTLAELDECAHPLAERGVAWLVAQQGNGWFREPAALSSYAPPLWADPEAEAALAYTTARALAALATLEMEPIALDNATLWLQGQIGSNGLLPGFRVVATAWALPGFVALTHRETRSVKRMVGGLAQALTPEWDAPLLTTVLYALVLAGFPRATRLILRMLDQLSALQLPSGLWPDEEGQPSLALTMQIVRAARRLGLR